MDLLGLLRLLSTLLDFRNQHFGKFDDFVSRGKVFGTVRWGVVGLIPQSLETCLVFVFFLFTEQGQTPDLARLVHRRSRLLAASSGWLALALRLLRLPLIHAELLLPCSI